MLVRKNMAPSCHPPAPSNHLVGGFGAKARHPLWCRALRLDQRCSRPLADSCMIRRFE